MGGIKNKLSKLSDKAKTLLSSLSLKGAVSRRLTEGSPKSGSRLPSFSQPSKIPDGQISNTRKFNYWGLYASKPIGSLRPITFTKYLGIACLSLAIVSTLILNVISSYSNSNIESNAEPASTALSSDASILANSSSLSISFSNATGSCTDTSNPANVCMSIPDGGGIATGGHTVTINTADGTDYELTISGKEEETALVNNDDSAVVIPTISGGYSGDVESVLTSESSDVAWAYSTSVASGDGTNSWYTYPLLGPSSPTVVLNGQSGKNSIDVRYGAKVADSTKMRAGNYSTSVVYTATAKVPPATLSNLILNDTLLTGQQKEFAVQGTNLGSTSSVKLCKSGNMDACYEATEVTTYPGTDEAETTISFVSPIIDNAGVYDVIVITDRGEARLDGSFRVVEQSVCRSGDSNNDCKVDIDSHMIPVKYTGDKYNPEWTVVTQSDASNPGDWYDYSQKKWANAVTVENYQDYQTPGTVVDNDDVLGYWVYIPRYAYEVQRRDAVDHYVTDFYELPDGDEISNEFIIHFEKATDGVKIPAASCNVNIKTARDMWADGSASNRQDSNILARDYRTSCVSENRVSRDYAALSSNNTTWGTHPAFRWGVGTSGYVELNGVWVGKFETTGKRTAPTVKPNRATNQEDTVGVLYTMAKSVGYADSNNVGGTTISGIKQNSHHLAGFRSHMIKNTEWGAVSYLTASFYGAGLGNVKENTATNYGNKDEDNEYQMDGITGCGYRTRDTGVTLNASSPESPYACGNGLNYAYHSDNGVESSTTNTVYGIYDMNGGLSEFIAANRSSSSTQTTSSSYFSSSAREPYVDIFASNEFPGRADWSYYSGSSQGDYWQMDECTWESCGGRGLHETSRAQSNGQASCGMWTCGYAGSVQLSAISTLDRPWVVYGQGTNSGYGTLFTSRVSSGSSPSTLHGMHVVLISQ